MVREQDDSLPNSVRLENNNLVIDKARPEISRNYACVVYTLNGQVKEIVYINFHPDGDKRTNNNQ